MFSSAGLVLTSSRMLALDKALEGMGRYVVDESASDTNQAVSRFRSVQLLSRVVAAEKTLFVRM